MNIKEFLAQEKGITVLIILSKWGNALTNNNFFLSRVEKRRKEQRARSRKAE